MTSTLSKQRDYKYIAWKYSKMNAFQVGLGKQLINFLGVKRGDKVLDMGCGTREITSFIAVLVGNCIFHTIVHIHVPYKIHYICNTKHYVVCRHTIYADCCKIQQ